MAGTARDRVDRMTDVQKAAVVFGAAFLLVGILGFIPGITSNFDDITFADHESRAKLLDIFRVNVLHNIVHILFGVAGLALSRRVDLARNFLVVGGIVYLVLWVYGLIIDRASEANFVSLNEADNWLHLVLGVGMVLAGVLLTRDRRRPVLRD